MPLPMVHLAVANQVQMKLGIKYRSDFYVGNIAPDAIHMRDNTTQKDKSETHLYFKDFDDIEKMKNDIEAFYLNEFNLNNEKHNIFTLGYCSHLITDYHWFKSIFKLFENRLPSNIEDDEIRSSYYFDTDHIDSKIYNWSGWTSNIMKELKCPQSHSNKFLSEEEINKWTERTINWFSSNRFNPEKETHFLSYDEIVKFIDGTSENVAKIIHGMINNDRML
jgi:hypothetical protein